MFFQDSLSLLLTCKQFSVDGVDSSLRRSLPLIFSKDAAIKGRLVEATAQLYVLGWAGNMFGASTACANLVELCSGATLGELTSLAALVKELVAAGHISQAIILELWNRVERAVPAAASPETPGHELYDSCSLEGTTDSLNMRHCCRDEESNFNLDQINANPLHSYLQGAETVAKRAVPAVICHDGPTRDAS